MAESSPADNVLARRKQDRERNLPEKIRPEVVELLLKSRQDRGPARERPLLEERADRLHQIALESGNRYGGNPDLLLKEHPRRDFENPPQEE